MKAPRCLLFAVVAAVTGLAIPPSWAQNAAAPSDKTTEEVEREAALRMAAFETPDDIQTRLFVDELQTQNPSAICFDDQGRMYIAEIHRWRAGVEDIRNEQAMLLDDLAIRTSADRMAMYEKHALSRPLSYFTEYEDRIIVAADSDRDGRADTTWVYADGFNDPLDGPGIGLIHRDNRLYYTNIPHLWVMEDTDNDGQADTRKSLQDGFGPRISFSGHDMHGLVWGLDGRLYWSIGDRGYTFTTAEGRHYEKPNEGAVFRCDPDGSNVEVYYEGLRNPQELAIDAYGNLFTCDNDADAWDTGRLVYLLEGGNSGWTAVHQTLMNFRNQLGLRTPDYQHPGKKRMPMNPWTTEGLWEKDFDGRPEWALPPIDYISWGPSGVVYNYGATALPDRYAGHFFVCNFGGSNGDLETWAVENQGAGFRAIDHHVFMKGAGNTDAEFGPDGRLYLSCFNNNGWVKQDIGNIYALYNEDALNDPLVQETEQLLLRDFDDYETDKLTELLGHADLRVRQRAQFSLAERGGDAAAIFSAAARQTDSLYARIHGIWGLSQLARQQPDLYQVHLDLLADEDDEIRAQAAKVLVDAGTPEAGVALTEALNDPSPRVQAFAAIGAGKNRNRQAVEPLLDLLANNDNQDPYLRHAAVQGLWYLNERETMMKRLDDDSEAVRLGILLTLRRLDDPRVSYFLDDDSEVIRHEAIRAIHDLDLVAALPELAAELEHYHVGAEAPKDLPDGHIQELLHNRLINANFRLGRSEDAERVIVYALNAALPDLNREQALAALQEWPEPTPVDPVTGYYRPLDAAGREDIGDVVRQHLGPILDDAEGPLLTRALQLALQYEATIPTELLTGLLDDAEAEATLRVQAIKSLASSDAGSLTPRLDALLADADAAVRAQAVTSLLGIDAGRGLEAAIALARSDELRDRQNGYTLLAGIDDAAVDTLFSERLDALLAGEEMPGAQLDLLEAAEKRSSEAIQSKLQAWTAALDPADPYAAFSVALKGGDADKGQELYLTHAAGQCNKCHKIGKDGGIAGPELTGIGKQRDEAHLLEALVNPSAFVVPGYGITLVTLKDGTSIGATLMEESDTELTLKNPDGSVQKVPLADIASRQPPVSAMPPMAAFLSKREIRDLVAFLAGLRGKVSEGH